MAVLKVLDQSSFGVRPKVADSAGERLKLVGMDAFHMVSQVFVGLKDD